MQYKMYLSAALLILLAGCQGNESKQGEKPSPPATTETNATTPANDTSSAGLIPLEDQYLPNPGQHCYIRRLYTKNDTLFIDADYIQFYVGKAADSVATKRRDARRER